MKIFLKATLAASFFLFTAFQAIGQAPENPLKGEKEFPKNIIKTAPFAFVQGQVPFAVESRLGYERVLGHRSSVAGSYSHLGSNPAFGFIGSAAISTALTAALTLYGKPGKIGLYWSQTTIETSGYRYQLQYKYFMGKDAAAPEGWYLSPHYSYTEANYAVALTEEDLKFGLKTRNRNFNMLFGYQGILGKHFVVDVFTGLGYKVKSTDILDGQGNYLQTMPKGSPLKFSTGLQVGWAF